MTPGFSPPLETLAGKCLPRGRGAPSLSRRCRFARAAVCVVVPRPAFADRSRSRRATSHLLLQHEARALLHLRLRGGGVADASRRTKKIACAAIRPRDARSRSAPAMRRACACLHDASATSALDVRVCLTRWSADGSVAAAGGSQMGGGGAGRVARAAGKRRALGGAAERTAGRAWRPLAPGGASVAATLGGERPCDRAAACRPAARRGVCVREGRGSSRLGVVVVNR